VVVVVDVDGEVDDVVDVDVVVAVVV